MTKPMPNIQGNHNRYSSLSKQANKTEAQKFMMMNSQGMK